jgi:hypothetical protein
VITLPEKREGAETVGFCSASNKIEIKITDHE